MKHFYKSILIIVLCIGWNLGASAQSVLQNASSVKTSKIALYPNPASDHFSIAPGDKEIQNISISNIVGKEIIRLDANEKSTYDIKGLKRGIYIIRLFDKEEKMIKALKLSKS